MAYYLLLKESDAKSLSPAQDDSKNKQQPRQMRGSLRSATHDETVSGFGRDDGVLGFVEEDSRASTSGCGRRRGRLRGRRWW
jgi:hypothetical protein